MRLPSQGALAEVGNRGVDLLLGDSTNAERPGMTGSERLVGEAFKQLIPLQTGRIVLASFASNIHRIQQAAEVAIANVHAATSTTRAWSRGWGSPAMSPAKVVQGASISWFVQGSEGEEGYMFHTPDVEVRRTTGNAAAEKQSRAAKNAAGTSRRCCRASTG